MKNENIINAQSVVKLDKSNIRLFEQNGLVFAEYSGEKKRVLLNLAFPYESRDTYVSVLDVNEDEIGIIINLIDIDDINRISLTIKVLYNFKLGSFCRQQQAPWPTATADCKNQIINSKV